MSSPLEATRSLLRTTTRTFHPHPKSILIHDALLTYSVLTPDQLRLLFPPSQRPNNKDLLQHIRPLLHSRLISQGTRRAVRDTTHRAQDRLFYYVNYHEAIDAIKYRLVKLGEKVEKMYKIAEGQRKDWACSRCGAEYDELSILDKVNEHGFYCDRCGSTLEQNEAAVRERGEHAKIRMVNLQLAHFNALLKVIDDGVVPENDFEDAWARRREPPVREEDRVRDGAGQKWFDVEDQRKAPTKVQQVVDAENVGVEILDERERVRKEEEMKRDRAVRLAAQNMLPSWHQGSAIKAEDGVKKEEGVKREDGASPLPWVPKNEDDEDKKVPVADMAPEDSKAQDEMDEYMREMEKERKKEEEREAKEAEEEEEDDEDEDDDDDFEDAIPSELGTPMSTQQTVKQESTPTKLNGNPLKRELDMDGSSASGTSTGANTPLHSSMTSAPDGKRIKLENGSKLNTASFASTNGTVGADSEEDEDFEDV